jgi:hypothetical protein
MAVFYSEEAPSPTQGRLIVFHWPNPGMRGANTKQGESGRHILRDGVVETNGA